MNDLCRLGSLGIKMFLKLNPTVEMLVHLPLSNRRPKNFFLIGHCCKTGLFVSCTTKKSEQLFAIQIRLKTLPEVGLEYGNSLAKGAF